MAKRVLVFFSLLVLLCGLCCGCTSRAEMEEPNGDLYSRDNVFRLAEDALFGLRIDDDTTTALYYLYTSPTLETLHGDGFTVSEHHGTGETGGGWFFDGHSEYIFVIDGHEWAVEVDKERNGAWEVTSCYQYIEILADYLESDVPLSMDFTIFPVRGALDVTSVKDYRCFAESTLLFDDICFLLRCSYDEGTFDVETARFEDMGAAYREDLFQMPAWVMLFGGDYYEYALIDAESNSIVYIAAQTPSMNTFEEIPEEFLPIAGSDEVIWQYEN